MRQKGRQKRPGLQAFERGAKSCETTETRGETNNDIEWGQGRKALKCPLTFQKIASWLLDKERARHQLALACVRWLAAPDDKATKIYECDCVSDVTWFSQRKVRRVDRSVLTKKKREKIAKLFMRRGHAHDSSVMWCGAYFYIDLDLRIFTHGIKVELLLSSVLHKVPVLCYLDHCETILCDGTGTACTICGIALAPLSLSR